MNNKIKNYNFCHGFVYWISDEVVASIHLSLWWFEFIIQNKVTAEHKTEEIREFSTRISEWEFGGAYAGLGLQPLEDTNYISDAISGALEDAISGSSITKIGGMYI